MTVLYLEVSSCHWYHTPPPEWHRLVTTQIIQFL